MQASNGLSLYKQMGSLQSLCDKHAKNNPYNELSCILFDAGARFVYEAETWRWMLKRK